MSTKITAPVKTEGRHETYLGSYLVVFEDGVAEVDFEVSENLKSYLLTTGYGVGSTKAQAPDAPVEPADPRDYTTAQVGTDLRDAAVDPRETDYLPPINAGQANPHGPEVVAPGIHAVGPGPIVPGTVGSPAYQEDKESGAAEATLVNQDSVPETTARLNAIARAEYALTKSEGRAAGLAQELEGDPAPEDYTAEERELLGLGDIEEPSTGDPAPPPAAQPSSIEEDLENADPDADEGNPANENTVMPENTDTAVVDAETLKGEALQEALRAADLPLTGTADEKRARLAEHQAQV